MTKIAACSHSNHLFFNAFCEKQPLVRKILDVAFSVLLVSIPIVALSSRNFVIIGYGAIALLVGEVSLIAYRFFKSGMPESFPKTATDIKPYSTLGKEALEFASKKLQENRGIKPLQFMKQPIDQEIAYLAGLDSKVFFSNLSNLIKENKENPWNNPEVVKTADICMKINFAISNLTLDDLQLSAGKLNRSYTIALTRQDSYQYRTFFYCTQIYHNLRGAMIWGKSPWGDETLIYPDKIPETHAALFYQEGTIQNSWNKLYNEYCDRVRLYVKEEELRIADQRFVHWTGKDTGIDSFHQVPDTLPT